MNEEEKQIKIGFKNLSWVLKSVVIFNWFQIFIALTYIITELLRP